MAKQTLIEIVQEILSDMNSDEVNSISDTTESMQVATIVRSTYNAMMVTRDWPHTNKLLRLTPYSDDENPTMMRIEDDYKKLTSVYYNIAKQGETRLRFSPIRYIEPDDMLRKMYNLNTDSPHVRVIDKGHGQTYVVTTNKPPSCVTSFNDKELVFDSYDNLVDDSLQASKTQVRAFILPDFILADNFIPDLPEDAFPLLIEESKSKASIKVGEKEDPKAEQESRRQNQWMSRRANKINGGTVYPNYGRGGRGYSSFRRDPTFKQD